MLALRTGIDTGGLWYYPLVAQTNLDNALHDEADYLWCKIAHISTHECRMLSPRTLSPWMPAGSLFFILWDLEISLPYPSYYGTATRGIFTSPIIAFRHPRNLKDPLVRATLNATRYEMPGNCLCGAAGCKTCLILTATDGFTSHMTGQKFKMKFATSCKSSNIVYLISCRRFGQQ